MKNSFTPCNTCLIAALSLCHITSCSNKKGQGCNFNSLTALEKENLKQYFKEHGCPFKN